ncbi:MAG: class IV adenylate cyclase [Pseudomonadota bacterium]
MEYEVKYKIKSIDEIMQKVEELSCIDLGKQNELDVYFCINGKDLRIRKWDKHGLITYKEAFFNESKVKIRKETETNINDVDSFLEILNKLGLSESRRKEKLRHTFKLNDDYILIDKFPFLGYYVELESSSKEKLISLSEKLGFDFSKSISKSYEDLFRSYKILNKNLHDYLMPTFENEREQGNKGT